jgi:initiation factor 1A
MPNMKGGKGYKKGSHESPKQPECNWEDGQQYGRILKTLGNKRFRVLCNDMKERVCKLAGSLRKSQWCEEGTFVILSLRGISSVQTGAGAGEDVGDILDVVEHSWVSKLKKDDKINKQLFGKSDEKTGKQEEQDDLFDNGDDSSEEEDADADNEITPNDSKTVEEKKKERALAREKKNKERDQQRNARRDQKNTDSGEIDIDAI